AYMIRVPAGTSTINLADLPEVRPLTRREQEYAITSVGVTVTEGTQASGSASLVNGNLGLKIQVPSFRPETVYPYIDQTADARAQHYEARVLENLDKRLEEVTTAYELAVVQGFDGTLDEWLDSLIGPGNVLSVDQVDTGAPGSDAVVTITGNSPKQALSFTIPRGDRGATGPANVLTVGEVVTGMPGTDAAVAISGKSPAQKVAFTIPRGDKGDKGDASKVPGPTGKSAYEYAVEAGFTGTEDEFAEAQLPDTIGWSNIEGKPSTFPPASHSHAWSTITGKPSTFAPAKHTHATADITGLRDALDTLMAALTLTDWTDCKMRSGFAANQGNGPQVQKENWTVVMRRGINNTGLSKSGSFDVLEVPAGFRPEESKYIPIAGSSAAAVGMAVVPPSGVVTVRTSSTLSPYYLFDALV